MLRWPEQPGVRLVEVDGAWCSPVRGAGGQRMWTEAAGDGRDETAPFADRRRLRPLAQPAR